MFGTKLHKKIESFLKKQSGGNITHIKGYKKDANVNPINFRDGSFRPYVVDIREKLTIECHCRNSNRFEGIDNLSEKVTLLFRTSLGVDCVVLEYHYSMYSCRD